METTFEVKVFSNLGKMHIVDINCEIYPEKAMTYTDYDTHMTITEYDDREIEELIEEKKQFFIEDNKNIQECNELLEDVLKDNETIIGFVDNLKNVERVSDFELLAV